MTSKSLGLFSHPLFAMWKERFCKLKNLQNAFSRYFLCLGALPLLYPAAPPSVFAFGKYTAPAVALEREYVVEFLGGYGLGIFLDYRLREAVLVINVFGFCDFGSACGFSIHLQSGFQPLLYMPFS